MDPRLAITALIVPIGGELKWKLRKLFSANRPPLQTIFLENPRS